MRMRQSLAEFERAFHARTELERSHGQYIREAAVTRTRTRRIERTKQSQFRRYLILVIVLLVTVVIVTWAMFETLAWLMS